MSGSAKMETEGYIPQYLLLILAAIGVVRSIPPTFWVVDHTHHIRGESPSGAVAVSEDLRQVAWLGSLQSSKNILNWPCQSLWGDPMSIKKETDYVPLLSKWILWYIKGIIIIFILFFLLTLLARLFNR